MFSSACGDETRSATCQIQAELSGAVSWQSGASDPACVIPFSTSTGVQMDYRPLAMPVQQLLVDVPGLKAGLTGSMPAKATIRHTDGRQWSTAASGCTVTVEGNDFVKDEELGKRYQLAGRGECASPAMPTGSATGTVTLAPFTFRFPPRFL